MSYSTLLLAVQDQIATITLNRPEKRNAISPQMLVDIPAVLADVAAGPARVAILTGSGSAFCAGMDLEVASRDGLAIPCRPISGSAAHGGNVSKRVRVSQTIDCGGERTGDRRRHWSGDVGGFHFGGSCGEIRLHRSEDRISAGCGFRVFGSASGREARPRAIAHW